MGIARRAICGGFAHEFREQTIACQGGRQFGLAHDPPV